MKKALGQFFTTNYEYILQNLNIPEYVENIIEPFCGNGDLLNFQDIGKKYKVECYDIEPKKDFIIQKDTIREPPVYTNKFVITNPPYLARNKSNDKELFDKYNVNDLYKCFIKNIINDECLGGIVIIPLNFWSSIRKQDYELRRDFLNVYEIVQLNIFEEQVFDDTTYTVCSFQFENKNLKPIKETYSINATIYPSNENIQVVLCDENNYTIGGEIYKLPKKNIYTITRATKKNKNKLNTNLLIKCIDDNEKNKISLSFVSNDKLYIDETPNSTARTYASLIIEPSIDIERQKQLAYQFNSFLEELRTKYHSLFLTNYRESKSIARKRISFDLVYDIIIYILENRI